MPKKPPTGGFFYGITSVMPNIFSTWSQRLTRRLIRFSRSGAGVGTLALASFLETTVFPLMIEIVAIPMMLAHRKRIPQFITIVWMGTILGAAVTYWLGYYLFGSLGEWFIHTFHYQAEYASFHKLFDEYGFWAIVVVGVLPLPFHIAMLTAGAAGYNYAWYLLAVMLSRTVRYSLLGLILYFYGYHVRAWQRKQRRDEFKARQQNKQS